MSTHRPAKFASAKVFAGLLLLLGLSQLAMGQRTTPVNQTPINRSVSSVPNGAKMKFKGVVIDREGDVFRIRDRNRTDYQVAITDRTSVKTHGGFLRSGKKYPVTDILRGLI